MKAAGFPSKNGPLQPRLHDIRVVKFDQGTRTRDSDSARVCLYDQHCNLHECTIMLPTLPLRLASAASSAWGDWDVEEEIVRELQGLRDDTNESLSAAESQEGSAAHLDAPPADLAPIAALWSALATREELADKLTATLKDIGHLPVPAAAQSSRPLTTASARDISAAVAALQEVTDACSKVATTAADSLGSDPTPRTHPASCGSAQPLSSGSASSVPEAASDIDALLVLLPAAACQLGMTQAEAGPADKLSTSLHPEKAVGSANAAQAAAVPAPKAHSVKQLLQDHASHSHGDFQAPCGNQHAALPAAAGGAAPAPPQPRVQLSPPHTPTTEDKRQHGMAPLLAPHSQQLQQEPSQQQAYLTCEPSSEATSMLDSTPSRSESGATSAAATAAAAAAACAAASAVAAEQATAQAAAKQLLEQQLELEQTLRQRVSSCWHQSFMAFNPNFKCITAMTPRIYMCMSCCSSTTHA